MELSRSDTAGIKGIAILFMLWHHQFLNTTRYGAVTLSLAIVFKVCVALFLFVSGYGLTKQYGGLERRNVRTTIEFLLRRFISFFLQYWFCFGLVVLIGNLCGNTFQEVYPSSRNTLKCLILDFFGQMGYNSYLKPWWFNKMIIQLYLIFPIIYMIISNKYSAWVGLLAIIPLQLFAKSIPGNVFFLVEGGIPAFYLGMISARYQIVPTIQRKVWKIVFTSVVVLLIIGLSVLHNDVLPKSPYQAILIRACIAFFIVWVYKIFAGDHPSLLTFLGKYATIMYLTHVLLFFLIPKILFYPKYSVPAFAVFVIASLVMAMIIGWLEKVLHYDQLRRVLVSFVSK